MPLKPSEWEKKKSDRSITERVHKVLKDAKPDGLSRDEILDRLGFIARLGYQKMLLASQSQMIDITLALMSLERNRRIESVLAEAEYGYDIFYRAV